MFSDLLFCFTKTMHFVGWRDKNMEYFFPIWKMKEIQSSEVLLNSSMEYIYISW